jgi:hypothetical protein
VQWPGQLNVPGPTAFAPQEPRQTSELTPVPGASYIAEQSLSHSWCAKKRVAIAAVLVLALLCFAIAHTLRSEKALTVGSAPA